MSKEVQELFTSIAPSYDFLNHFLSLSIDKRWRDHAIAGIGPKAPARILDLCAGTLDLTQKAAEEFPDSEVIAIDFALAMLKEGEKKIEGLEKVLRICADGHRLPIQSESCDALLCAFGVRNLEERETAAGEMRRALKPGGRLVVLEFFRPSQTFAKLFHMTYGKHVLPRLGGAISKNREAYEYLQSSIQKFFSIDEYCRFLESHGFKNCRTKALSGGIAHRVIADKA